MKLKNLFTCTVTGLLLCTSCIKDEAPNAEADILNCILPAEMLTGTDIDYNRPYDKSLNAYPIYIEVNNGTDLTRLAPTFELTEGASIEPANGSTQNFTNPVRYTVTSEDKNWHRTYAINIHYPETKSIPTVFNFENVKTVPYNKNEYYVLYEAASGYSTLTWSSGNQGFALTGSGYTPNDFPTSISPNGRTGNCLQLITRKTGSLGTLVGMPIAAGNLFIGSFDIGSAMSDALSATKFGTTFYYEPIKLVGYYKYKAGPEFYENGESTNRKDVFNIYALFYEKTKDVQMLDGHIAKNNYEHENMVAAAVNNAGRAIDVQTVIQQAIQILYPMLVNGVPVAFEQTEDALSVYLNTELLLPLLKTLVVPLLSDEEVVAMLVELMKKDPDFGEMAGLAEPMLKAFPEIIESTTKVEIGLNFVK